jgi:biopolymer transport protein ExbB
MHRMIGSWMTRASLVAAFAAGSSPLLAQTADGARPAIGSIPRDLSVLGMFASADSLVKAVIVGLIVASAITWVVLLAKGVEVLLAKRRTRQALTALGSARSLQHASEITRTGRDPVALMVAAAAVETKLSVDAGGDGLKERVASRLERIEAAARQQIIRGTGVLATIGATAPFVGLFGTVWGIMNSFIGISRSQTTNLAVVAPGIAEALLATAVGLVAAIPAVVIYNAFSRMIGGYRVLLADAAADVLRLVSRDHDRRNNPLQRMAAE